MTLLRGLRDPCSCRVPDPCVKEQTGVRYHYLVPRLYNNIVYVFNQCMSYVEESLTLRLRLVSSLITPERGPCNFAVYLGENTVLTNAARASDSIEKCIM